MAGKFVSGSVLRHVLTMAATGSIGLVSVFAVDLLNLFYLSLLGQKQLAAAVGYAGTLLFFITSLAIGLSIAVSALVARALGRGDQARARLLAESGTPRWKSLRKWICCPGRMVAKIALQGFSLRSNFVGSICSSAITKRMRSPMLRSRNSSSSVMRCETIRGNQISSTSFTTCRPIPASM